MESERLEHRTIPAHTPVTVHVGVLTYEDDKSQGISYTPIGFIILDTATICQVHGQHTRNATEWLVPDTAETLANNPTLRTAIQDAGISIDSIMNLQFKVAFAGKVPLFLDGEDERLSIDNAKIADRVDIKNIPKDTIIEIWDEILVRLMISQNIRLPIVYGKYTNRVQISGIFIRTTLFDIKDQPVHCLQALDTNLQPIHYFVVPDGPILIRSIQFPND